MRVEPLAFYRRLLAHPLRVHGPAGMPLPLLLLQTQVANVAGFLAEGARTRRERTRSLLPG